MVRRSVLHCLAVCCSGLISLEKTCNGKAFSVAVCCKCCSGLISLKETCNGEASYGGLLGVWYRVTMGYGSSVKTL